MADFVTVAELRSVLGVQELYTDAELESACTAATDIVDKQLWYNSFPITGAAIYSGSCFVMVSANPSYAYGETVTIADVGAKYNGNATITGTYPWTSGSATFPFYPWYPWTYQSFPAGFSLLQYTAKDHPADETWHQVLPYGVVKKSTVDYSTVDAVRQAALMVAVDIWQARQSSNAGGISPDGSFGLSPYRMGNSLIGRVRGLISPYLSPRGMVG